MESKVVCKLRTAKPTTTHATPPPNPNSMRSTQPSAKEEPKFAHSATPIPPSKRVSDSLSFQNIQSTNIPPSVTAEPSVATREPKEQLRVNASKRRRTGNDHQPVLMKQEEPLIQNDTENDIIAIESDEEAVNRPVVPASIAVSDDVLCTNSAAPQDREDDMKSTLAKYLRIIASTARGEASDTGEEMAGDAGFSNAEVETDTITTHLLSVDAQPRRPKSSTQVDQDESDVDPDEVNFNTTTRAKRMAQGIAHRAEQDREARAQRRAAEAEGSDVPFSLMVDRKPTIAAHQRNVIIKVREGRGKLEYSFVKPRNEPFGELRKELEFYAELQPNMTFELEFKKQVIKDTDTPESLRILYTARIRARRRPKSGDNSSDDVSEVERNRRRENLIKVTVQDENGQKHRFQHDKQLKFGSLFHAFAKMCKNDVRGYRFFYDGKRLSHDERPLDCEGFEDGALIDAFFETTGGSTI